MRYVICYNQLLFLVIWLLLKGKFGKKYVLEDQTIKLMIIHSIIYCQIFCMKALESYPKRKLLKWIQETKVCVQLFKSVVQMGWCMIRIWKVTGSAIGMWDIMTYLKTKSQYGAIMASDCGLGGWGSIPGWGKSLTPGFVVINNHLTWWLMVTTVWIDGCADHMNKKPD